MKLLLLLLAPALYGQIPGLVTVQAGALECGAVMRSASAIQTYCYAGTAPALTIVHNALNTLNIEIIDDFVWCVHATGCTSSHITWDFKILPAPQTGIQWQYTINASTIVSGILTQIYGTTAALPRPPIPWAGVAANLDGLTVPVVLWSHVSCSKGVCGPAETCATIARQGIIAGKPVPNSIAPQWQVICPLVNVFQVQ